jgi:hypothetical protein
MYGYDVDTTDTKQQRAMTKLMDRSGPRPATYTSLHNMRIDGEHVLKQFCDEHQFITNIIDMGNHTYIVEYMS